MFPFDVTRGKFTKSSRLRLFDSNTNRIFIKFYYTYIAVNFKKVMNISIYANIIVYSVFKLYYGNYIMALQYTGM